MKVLLRLGTAVVLLIMLPMKVLGKCPETVVFAGATDGFNNGQNTSIEVLVPPAAQAITGLLEIVGISSNGAVTVPGGSVNPYNFTPLVAPVAAPDGTTLSTWYRFSSGANSEPSAFVFSCNNCIASWGISVYQNTDPTHPIDALASDSGDSSSQPTFPCGSYKKSGRHC